MSVCDIIGHKSSICYDITGTIVWLYRIKVLPLHKIICNYVKREGYTYFKQIETSKFMLGV